ncbi:PREDICTED: AT-hook-containing transcription factor [Condylura cristata]|uniref:AT-hook-containing transcription factor n=1 Tax=Condylura cristata TaxID=143302 RepID=UPI0006431E34|nr:PREDICTED: AT-hook-containing transcription factor [Condylura cristata]
MASSETEVCWAEPGLGKVPRRRWAWVEEDKDASGHGTSSWGGERPFARASSPELLEDFRRAQQRLQPLQWDRDPQPEGHQDSESESAEEEFEAEDVDSPESSSLPPHWLSQQNPQPDMTKEEPVEPLGDTEAEEAGDSPPRLGYETCLDSGDSENSNPRTPEWGQTTDQVDSDKQANGDDLPEHSEVNPTADLSFARSWSSGTVSLDNPCDSLGSTWEEDTDVPQPAALTETLPPSPSHHLVSPDDRNGGSVTLATAMEFQDSSASSAQRPQSPADRWRRETTSLSCPQPGDQAWKRTRSSPKPLPSRFTGSISPQNHPLPRQAHQGRLPPRQGTTLASHSASDVPKYGRGRLNHPLPDLSKVGPRVRFPKDESYRPPKARGHSRSQGSTKPLIFKSPAEIVREVLLSSGEACLGKDPPPAHPVTKVPQEFQTPEQATKLVLQLQEDYHKLLTKYAEAENTIDQLRLGAKVNLYSDPPQPRHSIHLGTVPQGTKVMSFTIPQPHSVERWSSLAETQQASESSGWPSAQGDLIPSSPINAPTPGWLPENPAISKEQPSTERTQVLASQARQFLAKVESFVDLRQAGQLTPQDQLKGFQLLKAAHTALEEEYLKACREQAPVQQPAGSRGTPGKFDPGRELEAEIFQLGIRLEELKDHMDQNQQAPEGAGSDLPRGSPPATPRPCQPRCLPSPSGHGPTPVSQTLCSEPHTTRADPCPPPMNQELSSASSEADRPLDLPAPLRRKELQMEQGFHGLLERYLSVKSLPEAMRMEEEDDEEEGEEEEEEEGEEQGCPEEVDGAAPTPTEAEASGLPVVQAERGHRPRLEYVTEAPCPVPPHLQNRRETMEQMVSVNPPGFHASRTRDRHPSGLGKVEAAPASPGRLPQPQDIKSSGSHKSSLTSLEGSGLSEHLPQKPLHRAGEPHLEEAWMASPETDSGFVGSETSRVSPLTQTPEHRLSHISTPGIQPFTDSVPRERASHPQTRGLRVPRRASEPSTPRGRAPRHLSGQASPLQRRTPSFHLEPMLAPETAVERQKRTSEQPARHPASTAINPPPTLTTASPPHVAPPRGAAETTPGSLFTRSGRDQAIRELQEEVSRLRLRLEDSLHHSPQSSLTRPVSTFDRPTRARDRPADPSAAWSTHYGSKSSERLSGEPGGAEQAAPPRRRQARPSSVPRDVPRHSLSSESEPACPRLFSEKSRTAEDSPQATWGRKRGSVGRPDRVTFRGQYTGQEYHVLTPKTVPRGSGPVSCPNCQPVTTQDTGGAATREPLGATATDTGPCPLCGSPSETASPDSATSGPEKASTRKNASSTSSPKQKNKRAGSPSRPPPGLWYLAAAPAGPVPPAFAYVSSVPVMPYPSAAVYFVPPGSTSAPSAQPAAEWPLTTSSRPSRGHRRSIQLDLDDLKELNKALSQAVQAAESVRSTTHKMSRSLSADLRHARGLRGSCLF